LIGPFFRQLIKSYRIFAFGRFYSAPEYISGWGYIALLQNSRHQFYQDLFCVSTLESAAGIFMSYPDTGGQYNSHAAVARFSFPSSGEMIDELLYNCPAAPEFINRENSFLKQKCFCFVADDFTIWLPKLELAGRMFFYNQTLAEAAFVPGGLDFNFCVMGREQHTEIHATSEVGIHPWAFESQQLRENLAWLLTNRDVRDSFCSIWKHLNEEKFKLPFGGYAWDFNFDPPSSLQGSNIMVMGSVSSDKKHLLVWEIVKIEIATSSENEVVFVHPELTHPVFSRFRTSEIQPRPSGSTDSMMFLGGINTSVSYSLID